MGELKITNLFIFLHIIATCRSQWPSGLRRGSAAGRLLESRVRIPPGHGCLSVLSVVCSSGSSLRRADPSSRGALPTVVV
jgi:hypothetical protein